ncbi:MAG: xanthine dehydrogenase accessory protein XdhC [Thiolinea sp.]
MPDWLAQLLFLLRQPCACGLITLAEVSGSAPRAAGTCMLVTAQASFGTIGGGQLEFHAIARMQELLQAGQATTRSEHLMLGVALGQCCGGGVSLHYAVLPDLAHAGWAVQAEQQLLAGQVYQRVFDGFSMQIAPQNWHIALFGAGHVGKAVASILSALPCQLHWFDNRPDAFPSPSALPAHIHPISIFTPHSSVAMLPADVYYLVMTHDHALDLALCEQILRQDDAAFLGLIGSSTKAARFRHRLRDLGLGPRQLERLVCPVGIAGIADKHPAAIAVAIVAQVLQVRERRADSTKETG